MRLALLLWNILKDERGGLPLIAGAIGGGAVLGGLLGGKKKQTVYDPYSQLRDQYKTYLGGKLGTSTPYEYNPEFTIDQPAVEKAAEGNILGYFQNPGTNVKDYAEATKKYSEAKRASMEETYNKERQDTKDMYNRLGLVSSTPGLTALQDVNRKQATEMNLFDSELMYNNLDHELQAMGLDANQLNSMLSQASVLGNTQREGQKYSQQMSLQDIIRQIEEEQNYAQMATSILGGTPPTVSYQPNFWDKLGTMGSDILGIALKAGVK